MKIVVCVKPVPDTGAEIGLTDTMAPDLAQIPLMINPYDESAIEEAVRIVEARGTGEIVLVTASGSPEVEPVLKTAMATGAHRAILIQTGHKAEDRGIAAPRATARAMASVIQADGLPDLILTGRAAADTQGFQTAYRLAAALDFPIVTEVSSLCVEGESLKMKREAGSGEQQVLTAPLPCVVSVTKAINTPRYPRLPDIIKAKKKEVRLISRTDRDTSRPGFRIISMTPIQEKGRAEMLTGDITEQVETLIQRIGPMLGTGE